MPENEREDPTAAGVRATDALANERTYLAYVRTALAFIAFGFVIADSRSSRASSTRSFTKKARDPESQRASERQWRFSGSSWRY